MRRFFDEPYPIAALALEEVARRAVEALKSLPSVRAVFLFGSVAEGAADALSDYDFGVLLDAGADSARERRDRCPRYAGRGRGYPMLHG